MSKSNIKARLAKRVRDKDIEWMSQIKEFATFQEGLDVFDNLVIKKSTLIKDNFGACINLTLNKLVVMSDNLECKSLLVQRINGVLADISNTDRNLIWDDVNDVKIGLMTNIAVSKFRESNHIEDEKLVFTEAANLKDAFIALNSIFRNEEVLKSNNSKHHHDLFTAYLESTNHIDSVVEELILNPDPEFKAAFLGSLEAFAHIKGDVLRKIGGMRGLDNYSEHISQMSFGERYDPVFIYAGAVHDFYLDSKDDSDGLNVRRAINMMDSNASDPYKESGLYAAVVNLDFLEQTYKIFEENQGSVETRDAQIRQLLQEYSSNNEIAADNIQSYIKGYIISGDKNFLQIDVIPAVVQSIEDEGIRLNIVKYLFEELSFRGEYNEVVELSKKLNREDIQNNHAAFIALSYAKIKLGFDLSLEEIDKIKRIEPEGVQESAYHTLLLSIVEPENAMLKVSEFISKNKEDSSFSRLVLSSFCQDFIFDKFTRDEYAEVKKEHIDGAISCYEKLANQFDNCSDYAAKSILKLHVFNDQTDGNISESVLGKLGAEFVDGINNYKSFIKNNPLASQEEKNVELSKLTEIFSKDELEFLEVRSYRRMSDKFIEESKELSRKKNAVAISEEGGLKDDKANFVRLKSSEEIDLNKCTRVQNSKTEKFYYVYCDLDEVLSNNRNNILRGRFEDALQKTTFAKAEGQNGVKYLDGKVYELKINDDSRIIGTLQQVKNKDGEEVSIINFSEFHSKPHTGTSYQEAINRLNAESGTTKSAKCGFAVKMKSVEMGQVREI